MLLNLRDVLASETLSVPFDYTVDFSGEEVNYEHPFQTPVRVRGELANKADVFYLTAAVTAEIDTHCARCGVPVHREKDLDISLVIAQSVSNEEGSDDIYVVAGETFELDDIIREELILNMDMVVLCKDECKGLCPKCGHNLNEGECGCDRTETDPRLAKLKQLLKES